MNLTTSSTRTSPDAYPLPQNFVRGIDLQKRDFEDRMWSFLRGEWRLGGWWYYYLYAMLIKIPIGTHVLIALTTSLPILVRATSFRTNELILLVPTVCIISVVSSQTGFNHHLRYVFPAFPMLYIFGSRPFSLHCSIPRIFRMTASVALVATICSSLFVWPHSRSYFSEAIGGPSNGHYHLGGAYVDTNIDCGQDLLFLQQWKANHPEASPFYLSFNGVVAPDIAGLVAPKSENGTRSHGCHAISVNLVHDREGKYDFFLNRTPTDQVGYSIRIYYISPQ